MLPPYDKAYIAITSFIAVFIVFDSPTDLTLGRGTLFCHADPGVEHYDLGWDVLHTAIFHSLQVLIQAPFLFPQAEYHAIMPIV